MSKHRTNRLVSVLATVIASDVLADVPALTPARFDSGEYSLQNLVQFPPVEEDVSVVVYCAAGIAKDGRIARNDCFRSRNVDKMFRNAVTSAVRLSRASPAVVDGIEYYVEIYYRVLFVRNEGRELIRFYPNWGHDVDRYGAAYEGPQRYTHRTNYPRECRINSMSSGLLSTISVGADGLGAGEVSFNPAYDLGWIAQKRCERRIKNKLEKSRYIPTHFRGEPVEAIYAEPWGSYENLRTE